MRQPDVEVREVVCSETGKPMSKIPLWMADIKVKFISDEARQRHPSLPSLADMEPIRKSGGLSADPGELKELGEVGAALDDAEAGFDDLEEGEEEIEEDFEA